MIDDYFIIMVMAYYDYLQALILGRLNWDGQPSGFPVSLSFQGLGSSADQSGVQVATSLTAASAGSRCNEMSCHVTVNPAARKRGVGPL